MARKTRFAWEAAHFPPSLGAGRGCSCGCESHSRLTPSLGGKLGSHVLEQDSLHTVTANSTRTGVKSVSAETELQRRQVNKGLFFFLIED